MELSAFILDEKSGLLIPILFDNSRVEKRLQTVLVMGMCQSENWMLNDQSISVLYTMFFLVAGLLDWFIWGTVYILG